MYSFGHLSRLWFVPIVSLLGTGLAGAPAAEPLAIVTATAGEGATLGVGGPALAPIPDPERWEGSSSVGTGETVVTLAGGSAVVTLLEEGVTVQMEESSRLRFDVLPVVDKGVGVSLLLLEGHVHVSTRPSSDRWLVIAGRTAGGSGYTLSRGASLALSAGADGVMFAVNRGSAVFFSGDLPAGQLVTGEGQLALQGGIEVKMGQRITTESQAQPIGEVPDALSLSMGRKLAVDTAYEFGLKAGARWVADAERGDFTPVRAAARGEVPAFAPEGLVPEFAFDQPRSTIVAAASRTTTRVVTGQAASPVRALLETRRPTSVVVGQRLARTRIIGSPGTQGGPIRVNPNVEPLIRLPRR